MKTTITETKLEGTRMKMTLKTGLVSAALLFVPAASAADAARPTEPFRKEHVEVKEHLEHLEVMVGSLATAKPAAAKKTMEKVVGFLKQHIVPHAEWEEKILYPAVDKRAAKGDHPFTASMRHEHKIVGRWIGELEQMTKQAKPDTTAFARRADNLLGLIVAHFEEEEEVLLPILDKMMTPDEYAKEIGGAAHAG